MSVVGRELCLHEGCGLLRHGQGYCDRHYRRFLKYGTSALPPRPKKPKIRCSVSECGQAGTRKGLCNKHYKWLKKYGAPSKPTRPSRKEVFNHSFVIDPGPQCWDWQGHVGANGYGLFSIKNKQQLTHRLSWEWANGPIPLGMYVLHRCDNRKCVNPEHLFLGTHLDNIKDMVQKRRVQHSERHWQAKLKNEQVVEIFHSSKKAPELSRIYGVSTAQISAIKHKRAWRDVTCQLSG